MLPSSGLQQRQEGSDFSRDRDFAGARNLPGQSLKKGGPKRKPEFVELIYSLRSEEKDARDVNWICIWTPGKVNNLACGGQKPKLGVVVGDKFRDYPLIPGSGVVVRSDRERGSVFKLRPFV